MPESSRARPGSAAEDRVEDWPCEVKSSEDQTIINLEKLPVLSGWTGRETSGPVYLEESTPPKRMEPSLESEGKR